MAIIRELVTKLSFDVDRRGVENFNRSIIGFKTRFSLAATAVTGFFTGFTKVLSRVSDGILDTTELARQTGVATKELVGLQRAAGQFRISKEQFSSAFISLNEQIQNARLGFGSLFTLAEDLEIEIRDGNGAFLETSVIFERIVDAIGSISDDPLRAFKAKEIFGDAKFAEIAREGVESFLALAESLQPLGEEIERTEADALRFTKSLNTLTETGLELAFKVFPPLIEGASKVFEGFNQIANIGKEKGFVEVLKTAGDALESTVSGILGTNTVPIRIRRQLEEEETEFQLNLKRTLETLSPEARQRFEERQNIRMNNTINVTVPPGTEEGQREFIRNATEQIADEIFDKRMGEVGDNFPETE